MDLAFAFALLAASAAIIDATERATLEDAPRIADLAGAAEPSPTVTVAWVDAQSSLSDEATGSMIKEVNAVFRAIGRGSSGHGSHPSTSACEPCLPVLPPSRSRGRCPGPRVSRVACSGDEGAEVRPAAGTV